jgi:hypothetical protein
MCLGRFFSFLIFYTVGLLGLGISASLLPAYRTAQTPMPQVGFEPMIPVFEQAKTVHALDCVATVIGYEWYTLYIFCYG